MLVTKVAKRYAGALLLAAVEENITKDVLADMQLIKQAVTDSRELHFFLRNVVVKEKQKSAVLTEIFGKKVSKLTMDFIGLLIEKKRESHLLAAAYAYIQAHNNREGIIEVDVEYAFELSKDQLSNLQKKLETITGKKVIMQAGQNDALRGGLKVKVEDTVYDGTVIHKLRQLEDKFTGTAV